MSKTNEEKSRYDQVREILDKASGGSEVSYQGYKDFWNLPLKEFLELTLFGHRMIAPDSGGGADIPAVAAESAAPAPVESGEAKSCCGEDQPAPAPTARRGGRGPRGASVFASGSAEVAPASGSGNRSSRSWLIKALRGEFPFDESRFPPLLWGDKARPVSPPDIQFIANWIDAGCPANDEESTSATAESGAGSGAADPAAAASAKPGIDVREPGVTESAAAGFSDESDGLNIRLNALYLTWDEQEAIRTAIKEIKKLNTFPQDNRSFNYWAQTHGDHCQHGWEQFLTWHRIYLYDFEQALQQVIPNVTLPYWEWTNPFFKSGIVPEGRQSAIIPPFYRCWIDSAALAKLKGVLSSKVYGALQKIESDGQQDDLTYNSAWELFVQAGLDQEDYLADGQTVIDQLIQVNPMWHPLRYPGMFYKTTNAQNPKTWKEGYELDSNGQPQLSPAAMGSVFHHHYPLAEDIQQILEIGNWPDFGGGHVANQSFGALSQNPHNTGHIWLGGANPYFDTTAVSTIPTMGPAPLGIQPAHGDMFNDLLAAYDPMFWGHHSNVDRLFYEWQKKHPGIKPDDLTDVLLPFGYRVEQALNAEKLGYRYASTSRKLVPDSSQEIRKLKTPALDVDHEMLGCHQRAEITFHKVKRSTKSYFVRVFLNLPDASADTPIQNNVNFVGQFARFGHGECIGAPGHCDPPPAQGDRFFRRPRHHNEHHCYRLDATGTIRKLMEKGEKQFHINVVTVDPSGRAVEGLRMTGMSLNFYD